MLKELKSKYHKEDGTLRRPYNVLDKMVKRHEKKLLAEGFKANLPLIQDITKAFWNEVRELPDIVIVSNLGTKVDLWVPTYADRNDLRYSLITACTLRRLHSVGGMTEFFSLAECWYQKRCRGTLQGSAEEQIAQAAREYRRENDGVQLTYYSPSEIIGHVAEVKQGRNVRYLSLPFDEFACDCEDGVPKENGWIHPRWMAFASVDALIANFIEEYGIDDERFTTDMKTMIAGAESTSDFPDKND